MMEYSLEEDLAIEFKGGSLQLNPEQDKTIRKSSIQIEAEHKSKLNKWTERVISPFTQKIAGSRDTKDVAGNCTAIQPVQRTLPIESASNYFTFRREVLDKAVDDCQKNLLNQEQDGVLIQHFLLTEINLWDSDKERLILLAEKCVVVVKYDFIALKQLEHRRVELAELDGILEGDMVYPNGSLVPRLNGLADGLANVLHLHVFTNYSTTEKEALESFRPRERNTKGVRLTWSKGKSLGFSERWNPFNNDIPFCTLTSHPLRYLKDCADDQKVLYDSNFFYEKLLVAIHNRGIDTCTVQHGNIVLQNYLGLGSLIHNRNSLGFFKIRGKFSF